MAEDVLRDHEASLQLLRVGRFHLQVGKNVVALELPRDRIGEATAAPVVGFLDFAATGLDGTADETIVDIGHIVVLGLRSQDDD
jgi:hypothetical protein